MTWGLNLLVMTTDREIREQYRDHLCEDIRDIFACTPIEEAVREITKTIRGTDQNSLPFHTLSAIPDTGYTSYRNGRNGTVGIQRKTSESAADM